MTEEVSSKLSLLTRKLAEVGQLKGEIADKLFEEAQLSPAQLMFKALKSYLEEQKFEIFLVTPECYTIRAKFPEGYKYQGVADFVMARKEVGYVPGTRIPIVTFDDDPLRILRGIRFSITKRLRVSELTDLRDYIFKNTNLWLKPTNEK